MCPGVSSSTGSIPTSRAPLERNRSRIFNMPLPFGLRSVATRLILPIPVHIASGPNAGLRWSLASGRYRRGTIEAHRMAVVEALVESGDCFWDVGAHHGYIALLASRCVGADGIVYAFEPSEYNLAFLQKHLAWNRCANVEVVPSAISDREGIANFAERGSSRSFHIGNGTGAVEVSSLPALLDRGFRPPDVLKLDVEGHEGSILEAAAHRLPATCRILVSIHSRPNYDTVSAALTDQGFTVIESPGTLRLRDSHPGDWPDDPDLLAIGPRCQDLAQVVRLFQQS